MVKIQLINTHTSRVEYEVVNYYKAVEKYDNYLKNVFLKRILVHSPNHLNLPLLKLIYNNSVWAL